MSKIKAGMRYIIALVIIVIIGCIVVIVAHYFEKTADDEVSRLLFEGERVILPLPRSEGIYSFEQVLSSRRSYRSLSSGPVSLNDLSQILWSAQGITDDERQLRTAPSAGGLYPIMVFIYAHNVIDLDRGIYIYEPKDQILILVENGDFIEDIYNATLSQSVFSDYAVSLLIAGNYSVTQERYGDRAERYVHMEAGHIGQNICLQVTALDMGTVPVGAFDDNDIQNIFHTGEQYSALYLYPIGQID